MRHYRLIVIMTVCASMSSFTLAQDPIKEHRKLMIGAIEKDDVSTVQILLRTPYIRADDTLEYGRTWLDIACEKSAVETGKLLIAKGYDVYHVQELNYPRIPFPMQMTVLMSCAATSTEKGTKLFRFILDTLIKNAPLGKNDPKVKEQLNFLGGQYSGLHPISVLQQMVVHGQPGPMDTVCATKATMLLDAGANPNPPTPSGSGFTVLG